MDILWISAYLFAAVYVAHSESDDAPKFVLISAPVRFLLPAAYSFNNWHNLS